MTIDLQELVPPENLTTTVYFEVRTRTPPSLARSTDFATDIRLVD